MCGLGVVTGLCTRSDCVDPGGNPLRVEYAIVLVILVVELVIRSRVRPPPNRLLHALIGCACGAAFLATVGTTLAVPRSELPCLFVLRATACAVFLIFIDIASALRRAREFPVAIARRHPRITTGAGR